jgi:hypothetical protein
VRSRLVFNNVVLDHNDRRRRRRAVMLADRRSVAYDHRRITRCVALCAIYESFIAILTISALPFATNFTLLN